VQEAHGEMEQSPGMNPTRGKVLSQLLSSPHKREQQLSLSSHLAISWPTMRTSPILLLLLGKFTLFLMS